MSNGNPKTTTTQAHSQKAVANASGGEAQTITRDDADVTLQKGSETMLSQMSPADIAEFMNDDKSEFAPQIKSLEPGDRIVGILEGYGPDTDFTQKDPATGKDVTRTVHTWILKARHGNMRLSILSSVQLDAKLPPFIGDEVSIVRGPDVKSRSNAAFRVANYMVKGPPVVNKDRSAMWARRELPKGVIDVSTNQLTEGATHAAPEGGEDASA